MPKFHLFFFSYSIHSLCDHNYSLYFKSFLRSVNKFLKFKVIFGCMLNDRQINGNNNLQTIRLPIDVKK